MPVSPEGKLPDAGQEAVADALGVVGVAGQFGAEGFVFEVGAHDEQENRQAGRDQGVGGADDQRRAEGPEAGPDVAGVTDGGVRAGAHDAVAAVGLDADGRFEVRVDQHGPGHEHPAEGEQQCAQNRGPEAEIRPVISAHVQTRHDRNGIESRQAVEGQELSVPGLDAFFLLPRAALIEQLRIRDGQDDAVAEHPHEADRDEQPRPRQVEPPRRRKQQRALDERAQKTPHEDHNPRPAEPAFSIVRNCQMSTHGVPRTVGATFASTALHCFSGTQTPV